MRQFRLVLVGLLTSVLVLNAAFLRKTISVVLCGVLSFDSAVCYGLLNRGEIATAATPSNNTISTSSSTTSNSSSVHVISQQEQNIAGLFDLPKIKIPSIPGIPNIPGLPGGGNPLELAKSAILKEIGQAIGIGSPLTLDQTTAYADVSDQVKDFHPLPLSITSNEDLQKPLLPGDYSLSVIAYCTQFSIHAPGQGLAYKLARLQGKQAPAINALLARGTMQGIAPATLNANSWRIQAGLPLKQWTQQDQALIHKLIPEYEKELEGDYLQRIENTYNQFRLVPGIPSFNELLRQAGTPGQIVLQLRQARQALADQTIAAERLPDMLFEPTGNGLPRVLPPSKDSSPSRWAEIQPGVFARFTVIQGHLGRNLLEFRVTSKVNSAINSRNIATKELGKSKEVSNLKTSPEKLALNPVTLTGVIGAAGLIGYAVGRGAQALIIAYNFNDSNDCGSVGGANSPSPYPKNLGLPEYYRYRHEDFVRRNPGKEPPDYYLSFGERNLSKFMAETYKNPKLTSEGRKFLDTVRVTLQKTMEDHIKKCGARFAQLENDSYVFRQYAYLTHINAYCSSGWGNLPQQDRDIIIGDIKWSDKYDPTQPGGIWSGIATTYSCGSGWDLWPW